MCYDLQLTLFHCADPDIVMVRPKRIMPVTSAIRKCIAAYITTNYPVTFRIAQTCVTEDIVHWARIYVNDVMIQATEVVARNEETMWRDASFVKVFYSQFSVFNSILHLFLLALLIFQVHHQRRRERTLSKPTGKAR